MVRKPPEGCPPDLRTPARRPNVDVYVPVDGRRRPGQDPTVDGDGTPTPDWEKKQPQQPEPSDPRE